MTYHIFFKIAITWIHNTLQITLWLEYSQSSHIRPCFPFLSFNPTAPNFLYSGLFPSSLHHCLSAISPFFLSIIMRLRAFPHKQPNLSLWFSAYLFLGFLERQHICGKTKQPRVRASPLGIVTSSTWIKNRKESFLIVFWDIFWIIKDLPRVQFSKCWERTGRITSYLYFCECVFIMLLEKNFFFHDLKTALASYLLLSPFHQQSSWKKTYFLLSLQEKFSHMLFSPLNSKVVTVGSVCGFCGILGQEKTSSALTCWFDLCVTCCLLQRSPTTVAAASVVFMETVAVGWATGARIAPRGDGGCLVQVDFYCRSI